MKIRFKLPVVTGKTYQIEGELTDEEANSLLEFSFLTLLSRGITPASLGPSVSAAIEETQNELNGTNDDTTDDERKLH